ncbi:MAG: acetate/propionate family kinase [Alphaproteobacteria bacterium]|nr:acetate/propionate family kinase [Alphaproteobacteria bacterium]
MQQSALLCLNAGSSSIKFAYYHAKESACDLVYRGGVSDIQHHPQLMIHDSSQRPLVSTMLSQPTYTGALEAILAFLKDTDTDKDIMIGHRVVHGGERYEKPVIIDDVVYTYLQTLIPLAPLHQPFHLQVIDYIRQWKPDLVQVACFDTAFHRTQPALELHYPLPQKWTKKGIIRYGFHGLSYDYIVSHFQEIVGKTLPKKTIIAHLGNGASLCAVKEGKSVATTMGFTPLEGLMMGTRSGTIDPGIIFYLIEEQGMSVEAVKNLLLYESGLKGVSGLSHDVKILLESGNDKAQQAIQLYCYRIAREISSLLMTLGGLDAVIFTAGVGEHAALIRTNVCEHLHWLGIRINNDANQENQTIFSAADSSISLYVIPTNEEKMIAEYLGNF